jgi:BirA family biotin operon repressor/biotin-[acetyl-CoA-carboxylase] ligase
VKKLAVANPFGADVFHEETLSSTMNVSRILADRGFPHGTVIAADFQTAGKGRGGRSWQAQKKENLLFTILLRFADFGAIPKALSLKIGLAVSLATEEFIKDAELFSTDLSVSVKWPNDVMIGSKKVAGILCEGDGKVVHVGIGVNVNQSEFPTDIAYKTGSIATAYNHKFSEEDRYTRLEKILAKLYLGLASGNDNWRAELSERLFMRGKLVRFISGAADSPDVVPIEGYLQGIGDNGELLILPEGKTENLSLITGELCVYGK